MDSQFRLILRVRTVQKAVYRVLVVGMAIVLVNSLLTSACLGQTVDEETISRQLKSLQDPTILARRTWLDSEWDEFKNGGNDLQHTFGGVWAWRFSDQQDWGVRLTVPFQMHFSGSDADDFEKRALGDVEIASGTAFRLTDTWRAGGGVQLHVPSGTSVSSNTWRIQEFGAVAWDATPWLTFSPSFEHNYSVAEQRGVAPEHYLELFFPVTFLMTKSAVVTAAYEPKIDFGNHSIWTHSIKLAFAKKLEQLPLSFSISIKKPFNGDKQLQVNLVSTYYFSSK